MAEIVRAIADSDFEPKAKKRENKKWNGSKLLVEARQTRRDVFRETFYFSLYATNYIFKGNKHRKVATNKKSVLCFTDDYWLG